MKLGQFSAFDASNNTSAFIFLIKSMTTEQTFQMKNTMAAIKYNNVITHLQRSVQTSHYEAHLSTTVQSKYAAVITPKNLHESEYACR